MSSKFSGTSGENNNPEYVAMINIRVKESDHEEAVRAFLMKQFHVESIDELLTRRGVYSAVTQIDILLDELEKKDQS